MPRCEHGWVELGTDLEMYYMKRNNYALCLQCGRLLKIKYHSSVKGE